MKVVETVRLFIDRALPYNKFIERMKFKNMNSNFEFNSTMNSGHHFKSKEYVANLVKDIAFDTKTSKFPAQSQKKVSQMNLIKSKEIKVEM